MTTIAPQYDSDLPEYRRDAGIQDRHQRRPRRIRPRRRRHRGQFDQERHQPDPRFGLLVLSQRQFRLQPQLSLSGCRRPARTRPSTGTSPASPSADRSSRTSSLASATTRPSAKTQPINPYFLTVPTALMRQGNFSELLNNSSVDQQFSEPHCLIAAGVPSCLLHEERSAV